jgi:glycosyltransferase involved in cell wall biosynthesis
MTTDPWLIRHIDLADGPRDVPASERPHLLVFWWRSLPLGVRALLPEELPFAAGQMRSLGARLAADQLSARAGGFSELPRAGVDGIPLTEAPREDPEGRPDLLAALDSLAERLPRTAERLSVIVCTRDRPQSLRACLESLAVQIFPPGEVVVVDNSTSGNARSIAEGRPGVAYVHEPRPGLSVARNAGLAAARGELVAFTDDDVQPHAAWTIELVRAFDHPAVDAVTGLVLPARLDTPAQQAFELELGGFTNRYTPLVFDAGFLEKTRDMGPQVWRIGAGANMAFRRNGLAQLGGFDERLGAGASGCSEDSEFWYRILATGGTCLYEPRAVVFHHHREDWAGLRRQYRAYMQGHVAALVAQADRYGNRGDLRRIFRQLPVYFVRTALQAVQNLSGWRLRLLAEEVIGWTLGLQYLVRPGWRGLGRQPPPLPRETAGVTGVAQHA